jgi:hypothetical protein
MPRKGFIDKHPVLAAIGGAALYLKREDIMTRWNTSRTKQRARRIAALREMAQLEPPVRPPPDARNLLPPTEFDAWAERFNAMLAERQAAMEAQRERERATAEAARLAAQRERELEEAGGRAEQAALEREWGRTRGGQVRI